MAEQFANDIQTTLSSGINAVVTVVPVASATGFPSSAQYRIRVDSELMLVTAGAGANSWTVTRGIEGTTAATHANGTDVVHVLTAGAIGGNSDPAAGTPGLRTLGTGAAQAAPGNDSRLSDARTPISHTHPASDVASGTLATARLGSGTANSGVFLRGDQSWAAPSASAAVPQSILEVYVDYVNGLDANNGLSWQTAFKTIQAAYNALRTYALANYTADSNGRIGIGRIYLAPGDHNVGTGLAFDSRYMVELIGTRAGQISHGIPNSGSRIISSSSSATEFVKISNATSIIGLGFVFREVAFRMDHTVNTSLTKIIYAKIIDYLVVHRCSFFNADGTTNTSVVAIYQEDIGTSGGDGAWARITENNCSRLPLYKSAVSANVTGNFNRSRIRDNVVFYGGSLPMVEFSAGGNGYLVDGNNLEGSATGVKLSGGAFTQCTFLNNSGEDPTGTNPFYDVDCSCSQMIFMGGTVTSAGVNGTYVRFNNASSYNNLVIGPYDANGVTGFKRKVVDNSTANGNIILNLNHRMALKYKASGAFTDSDFTSAPPNGTMAVNGAGVIYVRAAGAWKSVATA